MNLQNAQNSQKGICYADIAYALIALMYKERGRSLQGQRLNLSCQSFFVAAGYKKFLLPHPGYQCRASHLWRDTRAFSFPLGVYKISASLKLVKILDGSLVGRFW